MVIQKSYPRGATALVKETLLVGSVNVDEKYLKLVRFQWLSDKNLESGSSLEMAT